MAEEKKVAPESPITLDFCHWLFDNFDDLVNEYNEFGRVLNVWEWRVRQENKDDVF
jgi:endonuclease IV